MNESHIQEILELERQKLAIQVAAAEVMMDDKIRASERRVIDAVTGAITNAVVELKSDNMDLKAELKSVRNELKGEIGDVRNEIRDVRNELKADILRLEEKIDNHAH
ncbi:hypothetical protein ABZ297_40835 [Nonomuraea sp. NPDC005983]|uniref:hypothetical protein n=1 Tax=Nonomuraea sp. NPDC005983 TaxID=3155595 RepID=UPI0033B9A2F7